MSDVERRALAGIELRAQDGEPTKIVGYAAVFNTPSEPIYGLFREVVLPGAFDRAIREKQDVRGLLDHDPARIIARTKSGTMKLSVDEKGLLAEMTVDPDDPDAAMAVRRIERGDLDGMSFAFRVVTDQWHTAGGDEIRELVDVDLLDVSVVAFPAYPATSVSVRAQEEAKSRREPPAPTPAGVPHEVNAARLKLQEG